MTLTVKEVLDRHQQALETLNFELLMEDYADDAVLLTIDGDACVGKEAIGRDFFGRMLTQFPDFKINVEKMVVEGDLVLTQWSGEASTASFTSGTAVLIVRDGKIQRQAESFQILPK